MAVDENPVRRLQPKRTRMDAEFNPARVRLDYNEFSDMLFIYLFPADESLVSVPVGEGFVALLVEPETEEIFGFQIDDFLDRMILEQPNLLELAPLAGIDPEKVRQARSRIDEDRWREAAISSAIEDLFSVSEMTSG